MGDAPGWIYTQKAKSSCSLNWLEGEKGLLGGRSLKTKDAQGS